MDQSTAPAGETSNSGRDQGNEIRVHRRADPFTRIDNRALNDERLSFRARGLLAYLLGRPPGWKIYMYDLVKRTPDGEHKVRGALNELKEFGYVLRRKIFGRGGRIVGWTSDVFEVPVMAERAAEQEPALYERPAGKGTAEPVPSPSAQNVPTDQKAPPRSKKPDRDFPRVEDPRVEDPRVEDRTHNKTDVPTTELPKTDPPAAATAAFAKPASTQPSRLTPAQEQMLQIARGARMPDDWALDLIAHNPHHTPDRWRRIRAVALDVAHDPKRIAGLMRKMIQDDDDPPQNAFEFPEEGQGPREACAHAERTKLPDPGEAEALIAAATQVDLWHAIDAVRNRIDQHETPAAFAAERGLLTRLLKEAEAIRPPGSYARVRLYVAWYLRKWKRQ